MGEFKLSNNGQGIDFNLFKNKLNLSDVSVSAKFTQIFKFFDSDCNGVLETSNSRGANEIQSLLTGMSRYAAKNSNSIFEAEEVQQYLDETVNAEGETLASKNIGVNDVLNFLRVLAVQNDTMPEEIAEYASDENLTKEELQQLALQTLNDDSDRARKIFNKQNLEQGCISDSVNWVKEFFNTENAASNIDRALLVEDFSNFLIQRTSYGDFTYREYYEAKIEFITQMLAKFNNDKDEATLQECRNMLKNLEPERLTLIIKLFATISDDVTPEEMPEILSDIIEMQIDEQNSRTVLPEISLGDLPQKSTPRPQKITVASLEQSGQLDKVIEFEDAFKLERGVEYNSEAINDYALKNTQLQILTSMNNNIASMDMLLEQINQDTRNEIYCSSSVQQNIMNFITNLYGNDTEKANQVIKEILNISSDRPLLMLSKMDATKLLYALKDKAVENYNNALGGRTLENYSSDASAAYQRAYGYNNITTIVNRYVQSQEEGVQTLKTGVQVAGMVVMIAGQCIPVGGQLTASMIYGGMAAATFGGTAIDAAENFTKEGGPTEQDKKEMIQELATAIALTASGMGIGKVSEAAFKMMVMKNCPKLLAWASEIGIDATMSLVADAAITGEIDLSGEGISQLTNVLVGIIRSKGHFKTYIDTHAGDVRTRTEIDNSSSLNAGRVVGRSNDLVPTRNMAELVHILNEQGIPVSKLGKETATSGMIIFEKDGLRYVLRYSDGKISTGYTCDINGQASKYYEISDNGNLIEIPHNKYIDNLAEGNLSDLRLTDPEAYNNIVNFENVLKSHPSFTELKSYLKKMGVNELNNPTYFIYHDRAYSITFDDNGALLGCTIKDVDLYQEKYFVYDKNGNAQEVTREEFFDKNPNYISPANCNALKNLYRSNLSEETTQNILSRNQSAQKNAINEVVLSELGNIVKTPDDEKILNFLVNDKSLTNKYSYNGQEIVNIMKSDKAKSFILDKINNNKSISRADIKSLDENLLTSTWSYKRSEQRDLTYEIIDIDADPWMVQEAYRQNRDLFNSKVPPGEVVNAEGQLLCNTGDELVPINLTKEKFMELFPIEKRHDINQSTLGDCWLITSMGALMDSPKGRAAIYQMFSQVGDDIYVKFPDSDVSIKFPNGDLNSLSTVSIYMDGYKPKVGYGTDQVDACKGIRMLERAYSIHRHDGYTDGVTTEDITDIFFMNKQMKKLERGRQQEAISNIVGKDNVNVTTLYNKSEYIRMIEESIEDPNKIITFSTAVGKNGNNSNYDLHEQHAYHIVEYNSETGMIAISNPWHNNKIQEIPVYEWLNYVRELDIVELK